MSVSLPEDITCRDTRQWLDGGFCIVRGATAQFTGRVNGEGAEDSDRSPRAISAQFHSAENPSYTDVPIGEIQCHWPVCGAINLTAGEVNYVMYVDRRAVRQWRRTFNGHCVDVTLVAAWAVRKRLGIKRTSLNLETVDSIFYPTYYSAGRAVAMIMDGSVSVAIDPRITLAGDGKGQIAVYYRTKLVGGVRDREYSPSVDGSHTARIKYSIREILDNAS